MFLKRLLLIINKKMIILTIVLLFFVVGILARDLNATIKAHNLMPTLGDLLVRSMGLEKDNILGYLIFIILMVPVTIVSYSLNYRNKAFSNYLLNRCDNRTILWMYKVVLFTLFCLFFTLSYFGINFALGYKIFDNSYIQTPLQIGEATFSPTFLVNIPYFMITFFLGSVTLGVIIQTIARYSRSPLMNYFYGIILLIILDIQFVSSGWNLLYSPWSYPLIGLSGKYPFYVVVLVLLVFLLVDFVKIRKN